MERLHLLSDYITVLRIWYLISRADIIFLIFIARNLFSVICESCNSYLFCSLFPSLLGKMNLNFINESGSKRMMHYFLYQYSYKNQ